MAFLFTDVNNRIHLMSQNNKPPDKISFFTVLQSVFAAAIGVQSKKNRQRDFEHGKPLTFIIAGLIFVVVFILSVYGVVQLVVSSATGVQ